MVKMVAILFSAVRRASRRFETCGWLCPVLQLARQNHVMFSFFLTTCVSITNSVTGTRLKERTQHSFLLTLADGKENYYYYNYGTLVSIYNIIIINIYY